MNGPSRLVIWLYQPRDFNTFQQRRYLSLKLLAELLPVEGGGGAIYQNEANLFFFKELRDGANHDLKIF